MVEHLPLQIAAGILIAGTIMFGVRYAHLLWASGERVAGLWLGAGALVVAGMLIAAGLGLADW